MTSPAMLLAEFDREMANTRDTLVRIPDGLLSWRPHDRSWSFAELAAHITNLSSWLVQTLRREEMDLEPPETERPPRPTPPTSSAELLQRFDARMAEARAALEAATEEALAAPWTLYRAGERLFTLPRAAVLRSFVFNHLIHHRGQLTVYLRLNDLPVPALYGPSADEGEM